MRHYLMILLVLRERCVMSRRQKEEQRRRTSLIREVNVPDIIHNIMFSSDSGFQQELSRKGLMMNQFCQAPDQVLN